VYESKSFISSIQTTKGGETRKYLNIIHFKVFYKIYPKVYAR